MSRTNALVALLGAVVGGVAGGLLTLAWATSYLVDSREGEPAALRRDLVVMSERHLTALARVEARVDGLTARLSEPTEDTAARQALTHLSADLRLVRDAVRMEIRTLDEELRRLAEAVAEVADAGGGSDPAGPLGEDEEPRWVVLASDPDPGVRFSALVRLGRRRSDRSVGVSVARLRDPAESVIWAALRNLGAFHERGAAAAVADLLAHETPLLRLTAHETLLQIGLPSDLAFDPLGDADTRAAQAIAIRAWADE